MPDATDLAGALAIIRARAESEITTLPLYWQDEDNFALPDEPLQDDKYSAAIAVFFDKTTYTMTMASLDWSVPPASAGIVYMECH